MTSRKIVAGGVSATTKELRETISKNPLLDLLAYHEKWHGNYQSYRKKYKYSVNEHLLSHLMHTIGVKRGTFVEFGAIDGFKGSNVRRLIESGWSNGIFIEPDITAYTKLEQNYSSYDNIHTLNSYINTTDSLFDDIVEKTGIDKINLCCIDIDGLDLEVWNSIERYKPDVVCIEGGQALDPNADRIPKHIAENNIQQSLGTYVEDFSKKGYTLVVSYQDNIFVRDDHADLFKPSTSLSTIEQYVLGVLAYPRLPWLIGQIHRFNLDNKVLFQLSDGLDVNSMLHIGSYGTNEQKSQWSDHAIGSILENARALLS